MKDRFHLSRFIRGEKINRESIVLSHRRIFILPTKWGFCFVALIMLLMLIAFIYKNNLAYLLAFLLASIFFISILHSYKALAGLQIKQGQTHSVFAGEAAEIDVIIANSATVPRLNLNIHLENDLQFALAAEEKKSLGLYTTSKQRGWQDIPTITLSSTYPFGLFRAWSPLRYNRQVLIYPKPSNIDLPFPEAEGDQAQGLKNNINKGNDDFYGLKEYQAGDSVRHIHWKAFAKGQGLMSKQYGGNTLIELWLNYEQAPGHHVEERLSQLCRWVIDAEKSGLKYGFSLPGIEFQPAHGHSHYQKCLEALALF